MGNEYGDEEAVGNDAAVGNEHGNEEAVGDTYIDEKAAPNEGVCCRKMWRRGCRQR